MHSTADNPGGLVVDLDAREARDIAIVGGKGANLGQLVQAGFPVPAAFVVTTDAYAAFLHESGLEGTIGELLAAIDYDNIPDLEAKTAQIRERIAKAAVPVHVDSAIVSAYARLGSDRHVAVRSSGTAEDLEGTSFAGLHDTYLDVIGPHAVVDAVKRCWGSLWSARAIGYRQRNGFEHLQTQLAVVVQDMVTSESSGVLFTGNPRTAATDETVINVSWGLGEAVVQGIVTPDEFVVKTGNRKFGTLRIDDEEVVGTRHVLERTLGSKERQFVRDPDTGQGTVVQDVAAGRRAQYCLSDAQVIALAALGRRVTDHYDGFPQDIEFAVVGEELYLLQSRPITGVEFSWDAEVNEWQQTPEDPFAIRSRGWADEAWTGAITPLMYSWRGNTWNLFFWDGAELIGRHDLRKHRILRYHRGTVYLSCDFEKAFYSDEALPSAREWALAKLPPSWHEDAMKVPFTMLDFAKQYATMYFRAPKRAGIKRYIYGSFKFTELHRTGQVIVQGHGVNGLPDSVIAGYTDDELEAYIERVIAYDEQFCVDLSFPGLMYALRDAMAALTAILTHWYTGSNENAFTQLVTGTPVVTETLREHTDLADIAVKMRNSAQVSADFTTLQGSAFFDTLEHTDEGREIKAMTDAFLDYSGHRGHADRDIYFPRYADDPMVLYRALDAHFRSDDDPREMHARNTRVRDAAYQDVIENLRAKPFGFARAEAFKLVHDYVMQAFEARDNERHIIDKNTYANRKAFQEVSRRLIDRGVLTDARDFFFLTRFELLDLLQGRTSNVALAHAKIEGRKRNFDRYDQKEVSLPKFLQRNHGMIEDASTAVDEHGRAILHGIPTSGGDITGTARVIKSLTQIGNVQKGEIMIANSTDPGWTPVFAVLAGVVVETGGLLSHSGCLAREYGFPAAQIENAIQRIPDGATIRLNGDTGTVHILDTGADNPSEPTDTISDAPVLTASLA